MRNWKTIFLSLFCAIALNCLAGCRQELGEGRDLGRFDPNVASVRYARDGSIRMDFKRPPTDNFHITDQNVVRLHKQELRPVVKGKLSSGKEYPVLFDSGAPRYIYIQERHIRENNLPYRRLSIKGGKPVSIGLSFIDSLKLDGLALEQTPAIYIPDGPNLEILGIPFGTGKMIIVSLEMMREFKYICIDDIKKEVTLSRTQLFSPDVSEDWIWYPMTVENKENALYLFVTLAVQGKEMKLRFDTGAAAGLVFSRQQWDKVKSIFPEFWKFTHSLKIPLGRFKSRTGLARNVEIAGLKRSMLDVTMVVEDNEYFDEADGFIGMTIFRKKTIVLDFARNLFWIKE